MPTASKSGSRKATRRNWRGVDRPRSHPGVRSRPRPNPFTELAAALGALIRFHESHPDWFPPATAGPVDPPALSSEWEQAIRAAYRADPTVPDKSGLDSNLTAAKNGLPRSSFGQVLDPTTGTYKRCPDFHVFPVRPGCES
jgi:hypothetical protein